MQFGKDGRLDRVTSNLLHHQIDKFDLCCLGPNLCLGVDAYDRWFVSIEGSMSKSLLAEEQISSFDCLGSEQATTHSFSGFDSNRTDVGGVIQVWWLQLVRISRHLGEIVLATLLLHDAANGPRKIIDACLVVGKLASQVFEHLTALAVVTEAIQGVSLASKSLLNKGVIRRCRFNVGEGGAVLADVEKSLGSIELEDANLDLGGRAA